MVFWPWFSHKIASTDQCIISLSEHLRGAYRSFWWRTQNEPISRYWRLFCPRDYSDKPRSTDVCSGPQFVQSARSLNLGEMSFSKSGIYELQQIWPYSGRNELHTEYMSFTKSGRYELHQIWDIWASNPDKIMKKHGIHFFWQKSFSSETRTTIISTLSISVFFQISIMSTLLLRRDFMGNSGLKHHTLNA